MQNIVYERKRNGADFILLHSVTTVRFGNRAANVLVTEQPQYFVVICIFFTWQNTETMLISNGLRFIFTCPLFLAQFITFHIMGPYYATWNHSSHSRNATCNDCHVPHENAVKKWFFKGMDGMRHASVFMMRGEPQVIQAIDESAEVIMNNCIRCHTQLNTEFVNTGRIDHEMAMAGEGKACWDCHREVPHGGTNSLSSIPNALVPYPKSVSPDWLKDMLSK